MALFGGLDSLEGRRATAGAGDHRPGGAGAEGLPRCCIQVLSAPLPAVVFCCTKVLNILLRAPVPLAVDSALGYVLQSPCRAFT